VLACMGGAPSHASLVLLCPSCLLWLEVRGCASNAEDYQSALKLAEACLLLLTEDQKVERAKTLRVHPPQAMVCLPNGSGHGFHSPWQRR